MSSSKKLRKTDLDCDNVGRYATTVYCDDNYISRYGSDMWDNDQFVDEDFGFNESINSSSSDEEHCLLVEQQPIEIDNEIHYQSWIDDATKDQNERGFLRFNFKIENVRAFFSRPHDVKSDPFECRGIPFCLFIQSKSKGFTLGAYLQRCSTEKEELDKSLDIIISCELCLVDPINGQSVTRSFANHLFRPNCDWGFVNFFNGNTIPKLNAGIVENNCMTVMVQVKAEPPFCYSNSSKSITGFVGIRNQGATCYMNSLLQVLFHITKFRTACYRIPTEMDDNFSMALALQKVFYNLQFSDTAVCTKDLTKSFGWSNADVLMQHDIQEMMRVLIERVESRMKNSLLEAAVQSIFQGKFISYVKCRDVECVSQREEVYYDVQLSLEHVDSVYKAIQQYVSPEMLDDENKYFAGEHGLQTAERGTLFMALPPVMFLHLLRFQFDSNTGQVMKNNNYVEFTEHLDMSEFLRDEKESDCKYTLFAVLSHSGGGSHGHYVAYINPALEGKWLKFDDDTISLVHRCDAIDMNFGCKSDVDEWTKSMQFNAYMLVYVRDIDAKDIFQPVDPKYITDELKLAVKLDPEKEYLNYLKKQHYQLKVCVLLSTILESDLRLNSTRNHRPIFPTFSVTRDQTANDFKKMLQESFKISGDNQIRIWPIQHCGIYSRPIYMNEDTNFVAALPENVPRYSTYPYSVWAEIALPGTELSPFNPDNDVLVYYYYYCALECRPFFVQHGYHDQHTRVADLVPVFNGFMDWSNRRFKIYHEVRHTKVIEMEQLKCLSDYVEPYYNTLFMNVIFELEDHEISTKLNSIILYYNDISFRTEITFTNADDRQSEDIIIYMSLQSTFPELLGLLASRLNYDESKIQIFLWGREGFGDPIPSTSPGYLMEILGSGGNNGNGIQLYYKLHRYDVIDVETKHNFTFQWISVDMKKCENMTIYLSDDESVESILEEARKIINPDQTNGSGKLRLLSCDNDSLSIVIDVKEIYKHIEMKNAIFNVKKIYRIEEIPKGDDVLNENEKYVLVLQWRSYQGPKPPGHSFIFKLNMTESWQCVKDRLRCRLNLSEMIWGDYRPIVLTSDNDNDVELDVKETDCLNDFEQLKSTSFSICLNNKNRNKRASTNKINL